jgi:hypothetical protein
VGEEVVETDLESLDAGGQISSRIAIPGDGAMAGQAARAGVPVLAAARGWLAWPRSSWMCTVSRSAPSTFFRGMTWRLPDTYHDTVNLAESLG